MSAPAEALLDELVTSELGVLPETYQSLVRVLDDPHVTVGQIASAVQIDPALTAAVLAQANSAAVSPLEPITTIPRAALTIGTRQLRQLALGRSVVRMFRGVPEHLLSMRSYWTHSIAVAMLAQRFAGFLGVPPVDAWFTAGLLHDVGTLALLVARPRQARSILMQTENCGRPVEEVEREVLGFDHGELGARLAKRWGLPTWQAGAIHWHHAPSSAPRGRPRDGANVVHLADVVVSALQIGNGGERAANPLDLAAWESSGLTDERVAYFIADMERQLGALVDMLFSN